MKPIKHFLHGQWSFSFTEPESGELYRDHAEVPGNVEPELVRLGLLTDYMPPDNLYATTLFDTVDDWTYVTHFDAPTLAPDHERYLVFEGIDTVAQIYLNGEKLADCANMHREWRFLVSDRLNAFDNELKVVIRSAELWARDRMPDVFPLVRNGSQYGSAVYLRKARHCWGWDNAPRLMTSGIFRPVYLEDLPVARFDNIYYYTERVDEAQGKVDLGINWFYRFPRMKSVLGHVLRITISNHEKVVYTYEEDVLSCRGAHRFSLPLDQVKLWWPYGFGEPSLYNLSLEMICNGKTVADWRGRWGIRTVQLVQTDSITADGKGDFLFVVNNQKVMIRGTNWKPADPLHSRADAKALKLLPLAKELNCNMVRIWGGGIYEDHPFFDYCDENGLLVWNDFMFACEVTPRDTWFCEEIEKEAVFVLRKLRNHPSLAVWCGDNEDDQFFQRLHKDSTALPSDQIVTRRVLRDAVICNDPYRCYVESSPKYSDEYVTECRKYNIASYSAVVATKPEELKLQSFTPEAHLYPRIDYATALRRNRSRFIGETGPIGFNPMTDNERIWERERARAVRLWDEDWHKCKLFPYDNHQCDHLFIRWITLGREQCRQKYGRDFTAAEWKEYCIALNLVCADIYKDVIEYTRVMRWSKTGVLWWSLCDMWPMLFNYSLVDSDLNRKLPFDWIRQSQRALALMAVRDEVDSEPVLYAVNDTLEEKHGSYRMEAYDESGALVSTEKGTFSVAANSVAKLAPISERARRLLMIEWTCNGETHCNHYTTGDGACSFDTWNRWNGLLKSRFALDVEI